MLKRTTALGVVVAAAAATWLYTSAGDPPESPFAAIDASAYGEHATPEPAPTTGADATVPEQTAQAVGVQSAEEALRFDAERIAQQYGWTFERALHALTAGEKAASLTGDLRRAYPRTLSGAWLEHEPRWRAFYRFVGPVPAAARDKAAALGIDVVFFDDGILSERQMQRLSHQLLLALQDFGAEEIIGTYDEVEQQVEAFAAPPRQLEHLSDDELRRLLPQQWQAPYVCVEWARGPLFEESASANWGPLAVIHDISLG